MASPIELDAMRHAIALSAHGLGTTSPNPPVGCVILDANGRIAGQGYHQRKGEAHAEVQALRAAGPSAQGGTAVVTLEPCNHVGRTPACRQALIDAGIARVVIAVLDPTSREEGGAAALRAAGVEVELDVLADEALLVLAPWLRALTTHRPVVTWTYRLSPDGITAALGRVADADSLQVRTDAVLHEDGKLEEGTSGGHGSGVLQLPSPPLPNQAETALRLLYQDGVRTLLLSGGPEVAEPYRRAGLVDELVIYTESSGPASRPTADAPWVVPLWPSGFRLHNITRLGQYVRITAKPPTSNRGLLSGH
jgi:diaminohydroxyphosphoribosylaminopyrimidine deaminase/5-amino-6-(5-phosphoribosylamino)uracil reductase